MKSLIQFKIAQCSASDVQRAKEILDEIAARYSMIDGVATSRAEGALRNYFEKVGSGFALGARLTGPMIVVDINGGKHPTPRYPDFVSDVSRQLRDHFGDACVESTESDWMPVTNRPATREYADRMKAFYRQHRGEEVLVKIDAE